MAVRLFVIPASGAPVAAVIRRGPSRWCQVLAWDMAGDRLTEGAWIRGRIYEDRCDVSPDGTLFLHFCHGGSLREGYTDSWTGLSRLPWLHALGLWPWGTTYGGGGRFVDGRHVVLRTRMPLVTHPDHPALGIEAVGGEAPLHRSTGEVEGADWSGRDHRGALVFARGGALFRRVATGRGTEDVEVFDVTDRRPDPRPAPAWAREPVEAPDRRRPRRRGG